MDVEKFREMYLVEAADHLQLMAEKLLKLDVDPADREVLDALFREAHSMKGMAATMEYHETARLAHHLEDELDHCRQQGRINSAQIDRFLEATDLLEVLLDDVRHGQSEHSVEAFINGTEAAASDEETKEQSASLKNDPQGQVQLIHLTLKETVAAPGARFLVLLKYLADFGKILESVPSEERLLQGDNPASMTVRLETDARQDQVYELLQKFSELKDVTFPEETQPQSSPPRESSSQTVRISTALLDHFINLTGELITNRYQLQGAAKERDWSALDEGVGHLARLVKNLHHQVLQVRMVALESIIGRLSRTVHDLSRTSGKDIQLQVEGAAIELDRAIIEGLVDPLSHMLRNAVDHGIQEKGTIQIKAWRERDQVMLQVADDGCGLAPDRIRQVAVEKHMLSPAQAKAMREYDLFQLICQPGFSTAQEVTELSGRGVGMDVVKTAVEELGGLLLIDSVAGEGTKITLKLPLTLAIIRALLVECGGTRMAMPITRVVQTLEVTSKEVQSSGKQLMLQHQDELLPLLSLRKILKLPKGNALDPIPLVITEVLGRRVALVVDRLLHQREIFVQRLPAPFDRVRGCSGATILGDGQIIFLLDLQSLLEKRRG
ncbi:MAG: chemotaxis protein CheA [Deltaproteobacteria bacterium]|nr:chemotaxis protein CheA [Deltaproteobacteria bacterium]MCW9048924.1 chemotaxis protein CheA [Deltaproteobacteria bacterium]